MIPLGFSLVLSSYFSKAKGEGRPDYSIFLRMADLMRQNKPELPVPQNVSFPKTTRFIKSFIEFLSAKNNLVSMRTEVDGIRAWITPVQASGLRLSFAPFFRKGMSSLFFGKDGTIKTELGVKDQCQLIKLGLLKNDENGVSALEQKVDAGLRSAWGYWAKGQWQMAEFALGYERDEKIFHKTPERLSGNRFRSGFTVLLGILRLHYGGGRFYMRAESSKQHIVGGSHETWRAFQSLRILNALDRVEDLTDWKFRLRSKLSWSVSTGDRSKDFELNGHNWEEVEAFLMQREFGAYMREHVSIHQPTHAPENGVAVD